MRVVIPTIGTRGDVQPFIALAQGLQQAGHTVRVLSHLGMNNLVEAHGIAFAPIGPEVDMGLQAAAIRGRSGNAIVELFRVMQFAFDILKQSHPDILAQCRETDLVVYPANSAAGRNEADALGLPGISVNFMPWSITFDDPERPWYQRLAYAAFDRAVSLLTTRPFNRLRRQQGLPALGPEGMTSPLLDLIPISPAVFPPNPHWTSQHRVVGYWFAAAPEEWSPPPEIVDFLEDGAQPIVVSLGALSVGQAGALETARLFTQAIAQAGMRAIIQGWEAARADLALPPTIYHAGPLPHHWLLPQAAAIVHHGGFGTTSAGFRAGIPQLVIPHLADQFYWGQRVQALGVGPTAIRRPDLTVARLVAALEELMGNVGLRAAAARLGEQVWAESGIEQAVHLIEAACRDRLGQASAQSGCARCWTLAQVLPPEP